jgi:hypothetical protein
MRIIIEIDDVQKASYLVTSAPSNVTGANSASGTGPIDAGPAPSDAASSQPAEPATSSLGAPVTYSQGAESAGAAPSLINETERNHE